MSQISGAGAFQMPKANRTGEIKDVYTLKDDISGVENMSVQEASNLLTDVIVSLDAGKIDVDQADDLVGNVGYEGGAGDDWNAFISADGEGKQATEAVKKEIQARRDALEINENTSPKKKDSDAAKRASGRRTHSETQRKMGMHKAPSDADVALRDAKRQSQSGGYSQYYGRDRL